LRAEELVDPLVEELWSRGIYVDFSPIILDVDEAVRDRTICLDMVVDAVIVFDRHGFFKGVLDDLSKRLKALVRRGRRLGDSGTGC